MDDKGLDWSAIWVLVWPIVRQGLIALLVSILALLGYDKAVPSRYSRGRSEKGEG